MRNLILSLVLFVTSMFSAAQTFNMSSIQQIGSSAEDVGYSVVADLDGNIYVMGGFQYTVDFDPGPDTLLLSSNGETDVFVMKLDSGRKMLWIKSFGGGNVDFGYDLATDNDGNVYISGIYADNGDYDPGSGVFIMPNASAYNSFVSKLDKNGNFIWAKSILGGSNAGYALAVDSKNNVYLGGEFVEKVDFNPGQDTVEKTPNGLWDGYLLKLNEDGVFQWVQTFGGSNPDAVYSVEVDKQDFVYTVGLFSDSADFDPGIDVKTLPASYFYSGFIEKLDSNGQLIWAHTTESNAVTEVSTLHIAGNGDIYFSGSYMGETDFDPTPDEYKITPSGTTDHFICKWDSAANLKWVKVFNGNSGDDCRPMSLVTDKNGFVYCAGRYVGIIDMNPNEGEYLISSQGNYDIFVQKLDSLGSFIWAESIGGMEEDRANSICVDDIGYVYLAGSFVGTTDFNPNGPATVLTSKGDRDAFLTTFWQSGTGIIDMNCGGHGIELFPNPTSKFVYFSGLDQARINVQVYNNMGLKVASDTFTETEIPYLDLEKLGAGIYQVYITDGRNNFSRKITVQ